MPPIRLLLEHAILTVVLVGLVAVVGQDLLRSMRRKGQRRRAYHGWFVWVWMVAGSFLGMAVASTALDPTYNYAVSLFGFGLLAGWVIGMIHGLIMLAFVDPTPPPSNSNTD